LYVLKSEHESLFKRREDELVADMRKQISIGYSAMRQRTAEAVEPTRAAHRKYITLLEEDRPHFVSSVLAESMNEVTRLRTKHLDYGDLENEDEHYDEGEDGDNLDHWYRHDTGYPDAAGAGTTDYDEKFDELRHPLEDLRLPLTIFLDRQTSYLQPERQLKPPLQRPLSIHRTTRLMRS